MPNSVQHREGKFLLRILADQHADVWEINEDNLVVHSISSDFGDDRTLEYVCLLSFECPNRFSECDKNFNSFKFILGLYVFLFCGKLATFTV